MRGQIVTDGRWVVLVGFFQRHGVEKWTLGVLVMSFNVFRIGVDGQSIAHLHDKELDSVGICTPV